MKLSISQRNLKKGLDLVRQAVGKRSYGPPVLRNVLVSALPSEDCGTLRSPQDQDMADNGRLKLAATDLEVGIMCHLDAEIEAQGAITVQAGTIADLVAALPPESVDLALDGKTGTLHLACGDTKASMKGLDAEEFPWLPALGDWPTIRLPASALREMIRHTTFAASTETSRPVLTGVYMHFEAGECVMAGADGFRLAVRTATLPTPVDEAVSFNVPARSLAQVARICDDDDEASITINLLADRGQVLFGTGDATVPCGTALPGRPVGTRSAVVSQLIDGPCPDYVRIIPRQHTTRVVLNTAELMHACKRADIFARDAANKAHFQIEPETSTLTLQAISQETGSNEAEIAVSVEGDANEIALNIRYVIDVLKVVDAEQIALEMQGPSTPSVWRPVGRDDYTVIIMPIHIPR